jgi:protein gp37
VPELEIEMIKLKPNEWWDKSWSVVTGCTPAGAGCDHCWALGMLQRFPLLHEGAGATKADDSVPDEDFGPHHVALHPERLDEPLRRRKPTVYAVSLLGDLFHEQVPKLFLVQVFNAMLDGKAQRNRFVLLTKRPQRAAEFLADYGLGDRIILMASVWDQASADAACSALSRLRGVRWGLHAEPLIGPIDWLKPVENGHWAAPSWIVCGGENGPGARTMEAAWADMLRDQCEAAGVPFWFKGWGLLGPAKPARIPGFPGLTFREKRPKHRLLCGVEHNGVPW